MARTARRVARRTNGTDPLITHAVAIGISGNSHFIFPEMNNQVIADHIDAWLTEKGLN